MNLFRVIHYIKYLLLSRHRRGHGIHSPFVFNLVSEIFRNKIEPEVVCNIENRRTSLIADLRQIQVTDLGAGSKRIKTNLRKVSDIARYSAVPRKYGILLSNMAKAFGNPVILEFGTSLGISTMYLASSCSDITVITMEGCTTTSGLASSNFREGGFENIKILNGSFDEILPELKKESIRPGLVFIDGNHRKGPLVRYFDQVADMTDRNSVVIIDDIYTSREMSEAWDEIRKHKSVTMTLDIFRMGIVFFKEGLNHFDYMIRY